MSLVHPSDYPRRNPIDQPIGWTSGRLDVGEEIIDRLAVPSATTTVSGTVYFSYFTARKSETVGRLLMRSGTTVAVGTTLCRFGVYKEASNGDLNLMGAIASDNTLFGGASADQMRATTATFVKRAGDRYAFAFLWIGTTPPTVLGQTFVSGQGALYAKKSRIATMRTAQTDLLNTYTDAQLVAASTSFRYAELLPPS